MQQASSRFTSLVLVMLGTSIAQVALAHGEVDEAQVEEFYLHLDDYQAEVVELIAELGPVIDGYAAGEDVRTEVAELVEHWEDVGIHAAIERKATALYPGVWQALILLQQNVDGGRPASDVAAAGKRIEAALWQGYGAIRLAATQVGTETAASMPAAGGEPESGPATVAKIISDLDMAVAAYQDDQLQRAEALIHQTYMTRFEGLEGDLIERDPDLVTRLEKDFNATLPLLMQQGASMSAIESTLNSMKAQLESASAILESVEASRSDVF